MYEHHLLEQEKDRVTIFRANLAKYGLGNTSYGNSRSRSDHYSQQGGNTFSGDRGRGKGQSRGHGRKV